ncbi:MAG: DUF1614 domain-containing protein [Thermoplasmatales archaeon]|nr:DUF1614 domain-containing protein [Thermoplasmatales archaeon]
MLKEIISFTIFVLTPLLLLTYLFFIYQKTFEEMYFGKKEVVLLVIGSSSTMIVDLPVFIYKDYFLALNIGGGLIPILLSLHFFSKKKIPYPKLILGISIVSLITYMVTEVREEGVVSYFPYYLLPPIASSLISLALYFRENTSPVYAYTISTLGVIIGGDFAHLPQLFRHPFAGSMGGAGIYDMIYVVSIISFFISFLFIKKEKGRIKREYFVKDLKYAGVGERIISYLLDCLIVCGFSFFISLGSSNFILSFIRFFLVLHMIYFLLFEFLFGSTFGKAIMNIEVIDEENGRDFMNIFTRNILRYIELYAGFYILSIILIYLSKKRQRLGDIIADTLVIKVKND